MSAAAELEARLGGITVFACSAWADRFPGLVHGVTTRAAGLRFGSGPDADPDGWERLREAARFEHLARCRQVHGARVALCRRPPGPPGVHRLAEADALVTPDPGVLLAVTVADCVPVFVVDPDRRVAALAHAGWRGTAAGVVEATLAALRSLGSRPDSWHVYLGPAICKRCYEVGPEVLAALGADAAEGRLLDLRAEVARRARAAGADPARVRVSEACTRCDEGRFYSYRGGAGGRRMCAFVGWAAG